MIATYVGTVNNGKIELPSTTEFRDGSTVLVIPATLTEHGARRKANGWLISDVGNMLMAKNGALVQEDPQWTWRFEVFITASSHEPWGPVGHIMINAIDGAVIRPQETMRILLENGKTFKRPV
ncbi:MAG: hypothetical protein R2911_18700 [Caldilineaceae bacterium]